MEARTTIKHLRISPKKLRFLADDVRRRTPLEAMQHLLYQRDRAATFLYKAIKSASANAQSTLKTDENLLQFKALQIDEGPVLKRMQPGGRGTAKFYKRRSSQITIVLQAQKKPKVNRSVDIKK